jgi:epoxyqueuosine reductase QueG
MDIADHPTVKAFHAHEGTTAAPAVFDAESLRKSCLEAGADDVGFVKIDSAALNHEREEILRFFPATKTLVSIVCRMNREPVRNPARSVANMEAHDAADRIHEVGHKVVAAMERDGVRAINTSVAFPREMDEYSGRGWAVSHKPVAVAAGLGTMGLHRCVIHPKFGDCILLGTVLLAVEVSDYGRPIAFNPCLDCKLCAMACPTGAISADGHLNFSACLTHNYRDYMGGFRTWVEQLADSKNASDYRHRVSDAETASMWQSLTFGGIYKCVYCLAVCPAGEDVIGPFLTDKRAYVDEVVQPLQKKEEAVYVVSGSDAEAHVARHFPQKHIRYVGSGLRPRSIKAFLGALPLVFQREQSEGLNATYHFTFTGEETYQATVVIRDKTVQIGPGHVGTADLRLTADSRWWLGFLVKDRNLVWGLARGKLRLKGAASLLGAFGKCFPS